MPRPVKGAEIIVDYLIKEEVRYLFGVSGHGNIGFLDEVSQAQDRIQTISVHHEPDPHHLVVVASPVATGHPVTCIPS